MGLPGLPARLTGNPGAGGGVSTTMKGLGALVAVLALIAAACGDAAVSTTAPRAPATTATSQPPADTTSPADPVPAGEVRVAITGTLTTGPDGIVEVCKAGEREGCFGVAVRGDLGGAEIGGPGAHRLVGNYDGRTIELTEPPTPVDVPGFGPNDFSTPCEGLTGSGQDAVEAAQAYTATVPGSYAGSWWDNDAGVFTVWFTDDDAAAHEAAIAAATGGASVCVIGGADYTEAELRAAQDAVVDAVATEAAMAFASGDTLRNRVVIDVEHVDAGLLTRVAAIHPGIDVVAFIEVLDGTLTDLPAPQPVRAGDVELVTGSSRSRAGMDALGFFTLGFDPDLGCFYFEGDEGRVLPIWPLGFSGDSGPPAQVFDRDGRVFATAGETLEVGGGGGVLPDPQQSCGAELTWVLNV